MAAISTPGCLRQCPEGNCSVRSKKHLYFAFDDPSTRKNVASNKSADESRALTERRPTTHEQNHRHIHPARRRR